MENYWFVVLGVFLVTSVLGVIQKKLVSYKDLDLYFSMPSLVHTILFCRECSLEMEGNRLALLCGLVCSFRFLCVGLLVFTLPQNVNLYLASKDKSVDDFEKFETKQYCGVLSEIQIEKIPVGSRKAVWYTLVVSLGGGEVYTWELSFETRYKLQKRVGKRIEVGEGICIEEKQLGGKKFMSNLTVGGREYYSYKDFQHFYLYEYGDVGNPLLLSLFFVMCFLELRYRDEF